MYKLFCGFVFLLSACDSNNNNTANKDKSLPQTLEVFADSLVRLDKFSVESLNTAAGFYQQLVPADTVLADSAAAMFLRHVGSVVDTTNQKLYKDTADYFDLVYNQSQNAPEKQKQFQQYLAKNHVILQGDGEGGVYGVADYYWIQQVLVSKTSANTDRYLSLLAEEEKNPTVLDASLAIEIKELVDRLIETEHLAKQKLPSAFLKDVAQKNKFYTGTLLFGSDNSPAIDFNDLSLVEQFKAGYEYLLANFPNSHAAQLIRQWQNIVKAKDSRKIEEWRSKYNPYE